MPNLVDTQVKIEGPLDAIARMYKLLTSSTSNETEGFLAPLIGDPAKNLKSGKPQQERIKHWDTPNDIVSVEDVSITSLPNHGFGESHEITCTWQTVWSPCIQALTKLSEKYNLAISISYIDDQYTFVGRFTVIDGRTVLDRSFNHDDIFKGIYSIYGFEALQEHLTSNIVIYKDEDILEECEPFLREEEISELSAQLKTV